MQTLWLNKMIIYFFNFVEKIVEEGRPLLIIADDVDGDVLPTLLLNKMRGAFNIAVVKCTRIWW